MLWKQPSKNEEANPISRIANVVWSLTNSGLVFFVALTLGLTEVAQLALILAVKQGSQVVHHALVILPMVSSNGVRKRLSVFAASKLAVVLTIVIVLVAGTAALVFSDLTLLFAGIFMGGGFLIETKRKILHIQSNHAGDLRDGVFALIGISLALALFEFTNQSSLDLTILTVGVVWTVLSSRLIIKEINHANLRIEIGGGSFFDSRFVATTLAQGALGYAHSRAPTWIGLALGGPIMVAAIEIARQFAAPLLMLIAASGNRRYPEISLHIEEQSPGEVFAGFKRSSLRDFAEISSVSVLIAATLGILIGLAPEPEFVKLVDDNLTLILLTLASPPLLAGYHQFQFALLNGISKTFSIVSRFVLALATVVFSLALFDSFSVLAFPSAMILGELSAGLVAIGVVWHWRRRGCS